MAVGDYCTLGEIKARLWPTGSSPDSDEDTLLQNIVTAVSRWVDDYTGTRFYSTAADETRYYTSFDTYEFFPDDDIVSITTLATDSAGARTYADVWAITDYDALPLNYSLNARPIRRLLVAPEGSYSFPLERKAVKIIGKFGYCTSANQPEPIREACLIQTARIWKRRDAPFGLISNPLGTMTEIGEIDPDVKQMLGIYRRVI